MLLALECFNKKTQKTPRATIETLGYVVQFHLIPSDQGADAPPVVVH